MARDPSGRDAARRGSGKLTAEDRALWQQVTDRLAPAKQSAKADAARAASGMHEGERLRQEFEAGLAAESRSRVRSRKLAAPTDLADRADVGTSTLSGSVANRLAAPPVGPMSPTREPPGNAVRPTAAARAHSRQLAPSPVPSPAVLDERFTRRIARGRDEIDARIDLHGMRQPEARSALRSFLFRSAQKGHRTILVITGKGQPLREMPGDWWQDAPLERGILRKRLPVWLTEPDVRDLVAGYDEAHARHGGGGAFYIRLRSKQI